MKKRVKKRKGKKRKDRQQDVGPWNSETVKNYGHVFRDFGLSKFPPELMLDHHLFRRGVIVAHRDFEKIFDRINTYKPFINMTGIASSGRLHFGHKMDIDVFKLFKHLGGISYFCIADIDAYCSREKITTIKEAKNIAVENLSHVLALGLEKDDVYVQSNMDPRYYEFVFELSKKITENMFEAVYGHVNIGKISAAILQYGDILHPQLKEYEGPMPSITGIGIDQDSHAKMTRDLAKRLPHSFVLPSFIYFKHQQGLMEGTKMSSSEPDTAIFLDDDEREVKRKIGKAFTGGRDTIEEQKEKGGRPGICRIFEIYTFHQPDDQFMDDIEKRCRAGGLVCGECKKLCAEFLNEFLKQHQEKAKKLRPLAEEIVYG